MTDDNGENRDADADGAIQRLLRIAGPRPAVDAERTARVRAAVYDAWQQDLQVRRRRRAAAIGVAGLAIAATMTIAIRTWTRSVEPTRPVGAAVARVLSTSGTIALSGGRTLAPGDTVADGALLQSNAGSAATLSLEGGGQLRIDAATSVTIGTRELAIAGGAVYLDTSGTPIAVRTPVGVVRDIGTRFEVRQVGDAWRARVRDGAIRFEGPGGSRDAGAGRELFVRPDGGVIAREAPPYGDDWSWATRAAPVFRIEGASLERFLAWAAREGGRAIRFADDRLRSEMAGTILHGSIDGLSVDEALAAVLPTCGLTHTVDGGSVVVRRP